MAALSTFCQQNMTDVSHTVQAESDLRSLVLIMQVEDVKRHGGS